MVRREGRDIPHIIIEGEETKIRDVRRTVENMIDRYRETSPDTTKTPENISYLSDDELAHLREWYQDKVKKIIHRKMRQNELEGKERIPEDSFYSSVFSNTIGQLEIQLEQALRSKQEGETRINPDLLGKFGTYKRFT